MKLEDDHEFDRWHPDSDLCANCGRSLMWHTNLRGQQKMSKDVMHPDSWKEAAEVYGGAEAQRNLQASPAHDDQMDAQIFRKAYECEPERAPEPISKIVGRGSPIAQPANSIAGPIHSHSHVVSTPGARTVDWEDVWLEARAVLRDHTRGNITGEEVYKWYMKQASNILDGLERLKELQKAPPVFVGIDPAYCPPPEAVEPPVPSNKTTHIFDKGRALCGMPGRPVDWPQGHDWVAMADGRHCTCHKCAERFMSSQPCQQI